MRIPLLNSLIVSTCALTSAWPTTHIDESSLNLAYLKAHSVDTENIPRQTTGIGTGEGVNIFASSHGGRNHIRIFGMVKLSKAVFDTFATYGAKGGIELARSTYSHVQQFLLNSEDPAVSQLIRSSTFSGVFGTSNSGVGYSGVLGVDIDAPDSRKISLENFLDVLEDYFTGYGYPFEARFVQVDAFSIGNPTSVGRRSENSKLAIPDQVCLTPVDIRQYFTSLVPQFATYKATF